MILTPDEIMKKLEDRNLSEVSRRSGISYSTLYGWVRVGTKPSFDLIEKLSDYFKCQEKGDE